MNRIYKELTLIFLFVIAQLLSFSSCGQSDYNPKCFYEYLLKIDSSITFAQSNFPKEAFVLVASEKKLREKHVTWVMYDKDYVVALAQNIFQSPDYVNRKDSDLLLDDSFCLLVFSEKKNQLIVLFDAFDERNSCKDNVSLSSILPYIHHCMVFDNNFKNIGDLILQLALNDVQAKYSFIRTINGFKKSSGVKVPELLKYNWASYKLIQYDEFRFVVKTIFDLQTKYNQDKLKWYNYDGDNSVVRFIEEHKYGTEDEYDCEGGK